MRRLAPRQILGVVGLSVPAAAVLALGLYFLMCEVPEIAAGEEARVKGEYRPFALALKRGETAPARTYPDLPAGWRNVGKMAPGKWGFVAPPAAAEATVWYDGGDRVLAAAVPRVEPTDFASMFWACGVFVFAVVISLTILSIRYFLGDLKARDDFLAATVHDLTTPLVALRGAVGMSPADERILVDRMLRLVRNVTDFLRLGGRRRKPEPKAFDLVALWSEAYRLFAADFAEEQSGPVALDAPESLGVVADETLTLQILWNLIANEFKYAAPYGPVRARIGTAARGELAEVVLSDSGPGLTSVQRKRLFERYYRARSADECGRGGFGIGLSISREFARAMGGELSVASNPSGGSDFTLVLPTARLP